MGKTWTRKYTDFDDYEQEDCRKNELKNRRDKRLKRVHDKEENLDPRIEDGDF